MNNVIILTDKMVDDAKELIELAKTNMLDADSLLDMSDDDIRLIKITLRLADNAMKLAQEQAALMTRIDSKLDRLLEKTGAQ